MKKSLKASLAKQVVENPAVVAEEIARLKGILAAGNADGSFADALQLAERAMQYYGWLRDGVGAGHVADPELYQLIKKGL